MRAEEIGTVYTLIKGAGGDIIDYKGKNLSNLKFSPKRTYPFIAGSKTVVNFIVKSIK